MLFDFLFVNVHFRFEVSPDSYPVAQVKEIGGSQPTFEGLQNDEAHKSTRLNSSQQFLNFLSLHKVVRAWLLRVPTDETSPSHLNGHTNAKINDCTNADVMYVAPLLHVVLTLVEKLARIDRLLFHPPFSA
jgi:hypothetical protein